MKEALLVCPDKKKSKKKLKEKIYKSSSNVKSPYNLNFPKQHNQSINVGSFDDKPFIFKDCEKTLSFRTIGNISILSMKKSPNYDNIFTELAHLKTFLNVDQNANMEKYSSLGSDRSVVQVTIPKEMPTLKFVSIYKPLLVVKCNRITTCYIDNYIFSLFSHPKDTENIEDIRLFVMSPSNCNYDVNDLLKNEEIAKIDNESLAEFLKWINKRLNNTEFLHLLKKHNKKSTKNLIVFISLIAFLLFLLIILFILGMQFFEMSTARFWVTFAISFIIIFIFGFYCVKYYLKNRRKYKELKLYNTIKHRLGSFEEIEDYLEVWNVNVFVPNGIFVTCPVTLEYLQFSLDVSKELLLEHHEISGYL